MAEIGKKVKLKKADCEDSDDHVWVVGDGCHEKIQPVKPKKPKTPKPPSPKAPAAVEDKVVAGVEGGAPFEMPPKSATKKVLNEILLAYQDQIPEIKGKGKSTVSLLKQAEMYELVKKLHKSFSKATKKSEAIIEPIIEPIIDEEKILVPSPIKPPAKVAKYLENLNITTKGKSINEICTTVVDLAEQKDQEINDLQSQLSEKEQQLQKALQELEELKKKVLDEVSEKTVTETCYIKDKHNSLKELQDDLECKAGVCDIQKQECVVTKKSTSIDFGNTTKKIAARGSAKILEQIDDLIKFEKLKQENSPLEEVKNAGGGNCFFHALAQIVYETNDPNAGGEFRKEVTEWLKDVSETQKWFKEFYDTFLIQAKVYSESDEEDVLEEQYGKKDEPLRKFISESNKSLLGFKTALVKTLEDETIWATTTIILLTVRYYLDLNLVVLYKNNLGLDSLQYISFKPDDNLNIIMMRWHKSNGQGMHFEALKHVFYRENDPETTAALITYKQFQTLAEYVYFLPESSKITGIPLKSCFTKQDHKTLTDLKNDLKCPSGTVCHLDQKECVPESSVEVVSKIFIDGEEIKVTGQNKVKVVEAIKQKILTAMGAGVDIEPLPFKPTIKPVLYQTEAPVWATLEDEDLPIVRPAYVPAKRTTEPIDLDKLRSSLMGSVIKVKTAVQERAEKVDAKIKADISRCFMENLKR